MTAERCQEDNDRVIAALARENVKLRDQVAHLTDSERRREEWLRKAKREAGFDSGVSFDDVWDRALTAYLKSKENPES